MNRKLAKVVSASIDTEDNHLILNIGVKYEEGGYQEACGCFIGYVNEEPEPLATFRHKFLRILFRYLKIKNKIENLTGQFIWVYGEKCDDSFKPKGLGLLQVNSDNCDPFIYQEFIEQYKEKLNG